MAPRRILIFSPYANWMIHLQVDAFVGLALQLRGAKVKVLGCEGLYQHCPAVKGKQDCGSCTRSADQFLSTFLLEREALDGLVGAADEERAQRWIDAIDPADYPSARYGDLPVGDWALSTALTQHRATPDDLKREPLRGVYRRFIVDTLKTYWAVSRAIERERPDHALLFSGRFYPYRAAFEAFRAHGIPATIHERGYVPGSFLFFENRTILGISVFSELYRRWQDVPLPTATLDRVAALFDGRKDGTASHQFPFYNFNEQRSGIRERLGIPPGQRVIGVFTSSFDELYSCDDYDSIGDQTSLLEHLFAYYKDRDVCVVVRHHPYIGGSAFDQAEQSMLCLYYRNALDAPKNFRVVMPKEKVISYDLFPHLDYAIAPYSTIAFELALDGIPVAVQAQTPHAEAFEFTFGRMSREEVFALCDRMEASARPLDSTSMRRAFRYNNVQFLLFSWLFQGIGISEHFVPEVRATHTDELLPGIDPVLDDVCAHLLGEASLYRLPSDADRARGPEEEVACIAARLAKVAAARAAALALPPAAPTSSSRTPPLLAVLCLAGGEPRTDTPAHRWVERCAYANLGHAMLERGAPPLSLLLADLLRAPQLAGAPYVLVHGNWIQYDERCVSYAIGALESQPGQDCAAFGAWLVKTGTIYGYLPSRQLDETLLANVEPGLHDPLVPLSLSVWRRDALARLTTGVAGQPDAVLARCLLEAIARGATHHFTDAMGMLYL